MKNCIWDYVNISLILGLSNVISVTISSFIQDFTGVTIRTIFNNLNGKVIFFINIMITTTFKVSLWDESPEGVIKLRFSKGKYKFADASSVWIQSKHTTSIFWNL